MQSSTKAAPLLTLLLFVSLCPAGAAERAIYDGQSAADVGIALGPWGSGSAEESIERVLANSKSIKIVSQGFYSGGRIDFSTPVLLYSESPASTEYLRLLIHFPSTVAVPNLLEYAEAVVRPKVGKLRLVLYPDGENQSAIEIIIPVTTEDQDGWWPIAAPLSALKLPPGSKDLRIRRMLIFSDLSDTFYVGEIRVINDTVPIKVEPLEPQPTQTQANYPVVLTAIANGGVTPLAFYWDFNQTDGLQEDAYGLQVAHAYRKAGEYTVTLIVKDVFGVKKEAIATVPVTVNE